MASHNLAIAKASFSAGLLRPDPVSVSRSSITDFHTLLTTLTLQCSPRNVQNCKQWILENIVQSTARCTSLGKYLMALTTSFSKDTATNGRELSIKRKRLHLLYLINDVLHHAKYKGNDASVSSKFQPTLPTLFGHVAAFKSCPKHNRKLRDLLDLWQEKDYYSGEYIDKLRETVQNAFEAGEYNEGSNTLENSELSSQATKSTPYIMPATHGDISTPWFDLPAGNLMPHIMPNSTRPINPNLIKPLHLVAGPADKSLALAVETLLEDVHAIFETRKDGEEERRDHNIDELGQPIILDEITGEVVDGEGYYGWSRGFCEKMKRRKPGRDPLPDNQDDGSQSRSRSSSPGERKRRYSSSSRSRSRSSDHHSRRRKRSYSSSRSRSPTPDRRPQNGQSQSHSRPHSRGQSSTHDLLSNSPHSAPVQPFSSVSSQLPPRPPFQPPYAQQGYNSNFPPPPPPPGQPPPLPFDPQNQNQSYGRGASGGWVPPPPPQFQNPQFQQQYLNPQFPNMPFIPPNQQFGAWPPPPPPPPPPGQPPFQQQGSWTTPGQGGLSGQQGNWQPPQGTSFQGRGNTFQQTQPDGGFSQGPSGWQQGPQGSNGGRAGWNGNHNPRGGNGRGGYRGRGW